MKKFWPEQEKRTFKVEKKNRSDLAPRFGFRLKYGTKDLYKQKFCHFVKQWVLILAPLNSDLNFQYGSGSRKSNFIQIRIQDAKSMQICIQIQNTLRD